MGRKKAAGTTIIAIIIHSVSGDPLSPVHSTKTTVTADTDK